MKYLLALSCLVLAATIVRGDRIDKYLELSKEPFLKCAKDLGLSGKTPRELFDQDGKTGLDGASCLRSCTLKAMNIQQDMKINLDKMNEIIVAAHTNEQDKIPAMQQAAAQCAEKAKTQSEDCKMAYSFGECYVANM